MKLRIKKITSTFSNGHTNNEYTIQKEINIFGLFKFWKNIWDSQKFKCSTYQFSHHFTDEEVYRIAQSYLKPKLEINYIYI